MEESTGALPEKRHGKADALASAILEEYAFKQLSAIDKFADKTIRDLGRKKYSCPMDMTIGKKIVEVLRSVVDQVSREHEEKTVAVSEYIAYARIKTELVEKINERNWARHARDYWYGCLHEGTHAYEAYAANNEECARIEREIRKIKRDLLANWKRVLRINLT